MTSQKYKVIIDENFHFMDENERYRSGGYQTFEDAVNKCKQILDEFLTDAKSVNDTPESLYMTWRMYGENPFVVGGKTSEKFIASEYVENRCVELTS